MTEEQTRPHSASNGRVVSGRYALLGELGRGGMGVVWRARDQVIGREVAIKELHLPDPAGAAVFGERVLREVRTAGRLNDPAVVTVFDVVTDAGTTYIVMELVEAPSLADLVRTRGPLPAAQVAAIGSRVLAALQAAHAAGIVHRDVKPANVMVAPDGRIKLADFGIAHAVDDPRITTSGLVVGSPAFMAPERLDGREAMAESDLWSLGATLYFAVEGVVAFERPTTAATLRAIITDVPYLTRGQGPLAAAILGLLVSKPEARLTAPQVQGLLTTAATGTPPGGTVAVPGGWSGPQPAMTRVETPKPKKSRRGWWAAAAAVLLLGGLTGGFFAGQAFSTPKPDEQMQATVTYGVGGYLKAEIDDPPSCYNANIQPGVAIDGDNKADCAKPHTLEVYDTVEALPSSSDSSATLAAYPPADLLAKNAEARCAESFHSSVVSEAARADLVYRALIPTEAQWKLPPEHSYDQPSRSFFCVLARHDGGQLSAQIVTKVK